MPAEQERVRFVFQKLRRELGKLAAKPQPGDIHDFRTYSRRVQTLLQQLDGERGRNKKKLLKAVARLRRRAGRVRDIDVQLAALRTFKIAQEPRRKTELASALADARRQQEKRWHKELDRKTLRELRQRLKKAQSRLAVSAGADPLQLALRLFKGAVRDPVQVTEAVLHRFRSVTKQARYLAEFAGRSPQRERLLSRLRRVQDALGDWHDWLVLTESAEKRFGTVRDSSLVAALRNLTQAKFRHAERVFTATRQELAAEDKPKPATEVKKTASKRAPASASASRSEAA